ncbi:unnamed protein product [Sphacelaria rigidula]
MDDDTSIMSNLNDANLGQLSAPKKQELLTLLNEFRRQGIFPADPKNVRPCDQGKIHIPLRDERCKPVATKQRRFSADETEAIQAEVKKLHQRGIVRRSESGWAARSLAVPKKGGTLRLCHDLERNDLTETDSGGLEDIDSMHDKLCGNKHFFTLDLTSGYF